jgi:hypothetical protein
VFLFQQTKNGLRMGGKFVGFLITVQNIRQFALVKGNYLFFPKKSAFCMLNYAFT